MKPFEYSALQQPIGWQEVKQELKTDATLFQNIFTTFVVAVVVIVFLVIADANIYIIMLICASVIGATVALQYRTLKDIVRMRHFAQTNGLGYVSPASPVAQPGLIFNEGHSRTFKSGFSHPSGWLIANYEYTTGSGKSSRTHHYGVVQIKLPRKLPHVLLDASANNWFIGSNLPIQFSGGQKLELEGDFNNYFTTYAPEGYGRDTLYFLTPELMAALVDYGKNYDFEVVDDNLFIYHKEIDLSLKNIQVNLDYWTRFIAYFEWQFSDNVQRYADERVLNSKESNIVAKEGRRLKRGIRWTSILVFIAYVAYMIFMSSR